MNLADELDIFEKEIQIGLYEESPLNKNASASLENEEFVISFSF